MNGPDFGADISMSGTFSIALNTTGQAVTDILGTPVNLSADVFVRVTVTNASLTVKGNSISADSLILEANFSNSTVSVAAAGLAITLNAGSKRILELSDGNGAFLFTSGGLAGTAVVTLVNGPDFGNVTVSGTFGIALNTTNAAVSDILGVLVNLPAGPFVHLSISDGSMTVAGQLIEGNFDFELTASGGTTVVAVTAEITSLKFTANGGTLIELTGSGAMLFTSGGVAAQIGLGLPNGFTSSIGLAFEPGVAFTLQLNTTSQAVTQILDTTVDLPAGPFVKVSMTGTATLTLANLIKLTITDLSFQIGGGNEVARIGSATLEILGFAALPNLTIQNLVIRTDRVELGSATLTFTQTVNAAPLFTIDGLVVTLSNLVIPYNNPAGITSTLTVAATTVKIFPNVGATGLATGTGLRSHGQCGRSPTPWIQRHLTRYLRDDRLGVHPPEGHLRAVYVPQRGRQIPRPYLHHGRRVLPEHRRALRRSHHGAGRQHRSGHHAVRAVYQRQYELPDQHHRLETDHYPRQRGTRDCDRPALPSRRLDRPLLPRYRPIDPITLASAVTDFSVDGTGLKAQTSAAVNMPLLGAAAVNGFLFIDENGLAGGIEMQLSVGTFSGAGNLFTLDGTFLLELNTGSQARTIKTFSIDPDSGDIDTATTRSLAAQTARVVLGGELTTLALFNLRGQFDMTINSSGFAVSLDASLDLGGFGSLAVNGSAAITNDPHFILDINIGAEKIAIPLIKVDGDFRVRINTSNNTYLVSISEVEVKVAYFEMTGDSASIGLSGGVFQITFNNLELALDLDVPLLGDLLSVDVSIDGYIKSNFQFDLSGTASTDLSLDLFVATLGVEVDTSVGLSDSEFDVSFEITGSYEDLLGISVDVSASAEVEITATGMTAKFKLLDITIFEVELGSQPDDDDAPEYVSKSGSTLTVDSDLIHSTTFNFEGSGGNVQLIGESSVFDDFESDNFSGINTIVLNASDGPAITINVQSGISSAVDFTTGDGADTINALGSGGGTINSGGGADNVILGSGNYTVNAGSGNDNVTASLPPVTPYLVEMERTASSDSAEQTPLTARKMIPPATFATRLSRAASRPRWQLQSTLSSTSS